MQNNIFLRDICRILIFIQHRFLFNTEFTENHRVSQSNYFFIQIFIDFTELFE